MRLDRPTLALVCALALAAPASAQHRDRDDDDHAAAAAAAATHTGDQEGDAALRLHGGHGEHHDPVAHLEAELTPATAARVRAAVGFARRHLQTSAVDRNIRAATLLLERAGGGHHPSEAQLLGALLEGAPAEAVRTRFGPEVADALAHPTPARRVATALEALRGPAVLTTAERTRLLDATRDGLLADLRREGDPLARAVERELDRATVALAGPDASIERKVADLLALARGKLPPAEVVRLASAVEVAKAAHAGQARDGGEPALLHSLRVATGLLARPGAIEAAAVHAAVLHDVVEDTRTPLSELRTRFGPRVAELVNDVTLDPLEAFGNDKAARDRAYYARFARSSPSAHLIKLLDRIDNVNDMRGWEAEGKLGYLKRTRETVLAALERDPRLAAELNAEVERLELRASAEAGHGAGEGALARYRRADGTLRWKELAADRARHEGRALGQFGLSLFLKEMAVVVRTGDRLRVEEFFDGLLSTDFYVHYGVFSLGARAGEVAFARSLERVLRPRFVASLLKSNVALATGLLAGELAAGTLSGEHFAISLASLGLSTTAVRAGVLGLTWVRDLAQARTAALTGTSRRLLTAGRLAGATGWIYAVAETTVVLYVAEALEERLHAWKDEAEARAKLVAACKALLATSVRLGRGERPDAAAELEAALAAHAQAWTGWRDHLLAPLAAEDARLQARLAGFARRAKILADERAAATVGLEAQPALAARIVARHGSLEAWADARAREDEASLQDDVDLALAAHTRARDEVLRAAYGAPRRGAPLFAGVSHLEWAARGGLAAGDPWRGRRDPLAAWARRSARSTFDAALGRASRNRLEAYGDERAVLELAARLLGARGVPVRSAAALATRAEALDARAYAWSTAEPTTTRGLTGSVDGR